MIQAMKFNSIAGEETNIVLQCQQLSSYHLNHFRKVFYCLNKINHIPLNKNKTSSDRQDYFCTNENLNELFPLIMSLYSPFITEWWRVIPGHHFPVRVVCIKSCLYWGHWLYSIEIDPWKIYNHWGGRG